MAMETPYSSRFGPYYLSDPAHPYFTSKQAPNSMSDETTEHRITSDESGQQVGGGLLAPLLPSETASADQATINLNQYVQFKEQQERTHHVDTATIETAVRMILESIGEDLSRPGLRETPARVARFYQEFFDYDPGRTDTTFNQEIVSDQMVIVAGMRVWSMCEHHMLPFYTDVSCGYIADGEVLGLSKFARIAEQFAHRLQTQENLATQIADEIERITGKRNVAVLCENGMHTCMAMRGVRKNGSMSNSVMRGVFSRRPSARAEFLHLVERNRK